MKEPHIDIQSYFQNWAQDKKKEAEEMEKICGKTRCIRKR